MGEKILRHLWEFDHPYYCSESNYFTNESCESAYKSWAEFIESNGESDFDMNLVFRFDWEEHDDDGENNFKGDVNFRNGKLKIFWMGQRKGLYRWSIVEVCRADEPEVIKFLKPRWEHMQKLWEGIS